MKVLITGSKGQLGTTLVNQIERSDHVVVAHDIDTLDLLDGKAVTNCFADCKPDVVVNAAAYTAVDQAEQEPEKADSLNHDIVRRLVSECTRHSARLIQVSTDFVFDGKKSSPYIPGDTCAPLSVYGKTKLAGEKVILDAADCLGLIIRTAWLYSPHGHNFVKTMLRLMAERSELKVISDQVGTPTAATGLSQVILRAIDLDNIQGIYHWTDAGVASWYDFAVAIYEEATELELLEKPVNLIPITTKEYPTPATRPPYSVLDKSATYRDFDVQAVHWRCQLRSVLRALKNQSD